MSDRSSHAGGGAVRVLQFVNEQTQFLKHGFVRCGSLWWFRFRTELGIDGSGAGHTMHV